jgi:hypothetical protein
MFSKRSGRPPFIADAQLQELIAFVCASCHNRRLSWAELPFEYPMCTWPNATEWSITSALRRAGFRRRIARTKPPISEENRLLRLAFAHEHLNWSRDQWFRVLWTDETWVTEGIHRRIWVSVRKGEELDSTAIVERRRSHTGWMFWACFSGTTKGPCVFWEKNWGHINQASYIEHIIPVLDDWLQQHPELRFIQDNAPGHRGRKTQAEIKRRKMPKIIWPPYSPDLNLIEKIWDWMKDYLETTFPEQMTYPQLRRAVQEAWDFITVDQLNELIDSMHDRCQAVIDADGKQIPY